MIGLDSYILKIIGFFIEIIIRSAHYFNNLPGSVWYFGYITNFSILLYLFGFFWICIWKTAWRLFGLAIMTVSFIFMLYSPKPELIFDAGNMTIGFKNKENKLEIYADKMATFNRVYWANWFGQKDSTILPLKNNIFITNYGQRIVFSEDIVNSVKLGYKEREAKPIGNRKTASNDIGELKSIDYNYCKEAEIYINLNHETKCTGSLITIDRNFLIKNPVILIFCNSRKCRIKSNNAASYTNCII